MENNIEKRAAWGLTHANVVGDFPWLARSVWTWENKQLFLIPAS